MDILDRVLVLFGILAMIAILVLKIIEIRQNRENLRQNRDSLKFARERFENEKQAVEILKEINHQQNRNHTLNLN